MVGESLLGGTLASPTALGHGPGSRGQCPSPYVDGGGGYRLGGGRATGTPVFTESVRNVFFSECLVALASTSGARHVWAVA